MWREHRRKKSRKRRIYLCKECGLAPYIFSALRRALLRFRSFAASSQARAGALCLLCRTPCATSISQLRCSISVAGWRPMPSLPYAVRYFDSAASLLHLSRGLAPYVFSVVRRALLRFRSFAAPSQSRAGALCLPCLTPCATSIPQLRCSISVAGWRPMPNQKNGAVASMIRKS